MVKWSCEKSSFAQVFLEKLFWHFSKSLLPLCVVCCLSRLLFSWFHFASKILNLYSWACHELIRVILMIRREVFQAVNWSRLFREVFKSYHSPPLVARCKFCYGRYFVVVLVTKKIWCLCQSCRSSIKLEHDYCLHSCNENSPMPAGSTWAPLMRVLWTLWQKLVTKQRVLWCPCYYS